VLAFVLWLYVFLSGPWQGILFAAAYLAAALVGFAVFKRLRRTP
jgi:membrane protein implicated in regulation of membrane protease activity